MLLRSHFPPLIGLSHIQLYLSHGTITCALDVEALVQPVLDLVQLSASMVACIIWCGRINNRSIPVAGIRLNYHTYMRKAGLSFGASISSVGMGTGRRYK